MYVNGEQQRISQALLARVQKAKLIPKETFSDAVTRLLDERDALLFEKQHPRTDTGLFSAKRSGGK